MFGKTKNNEQTKNTLKHSIIIMLGQKQLQQRVEKSLRLWGFLTVTSFYNQEVAKGALNRTHRIFVSQIFDIEV